jgi:hypothetical protein
MGYSDIAALNQDSDFSQRVMAAYAVETLDDAGAIDPGSWQAMHSWDMSAQPGFGDAYASAIAGSVERPGNDPSVITDGQILSAVQSLLPQPVEEPTP